MDSDFFKTQRDLGIDLVTELRAVGFVDVAEIGRGGFGVVYRCTQPGLDRVVAVKVLTCELEENRERFFREQRAMGRLTGHPNIMEVLEVGETATGQPYLVMPYHCQGSLDARIRRDGPLPLEEVLHVGVKLAGALETAHHADIFHRDVKPANILLTDYGEPTLSDFGIAHLTGGFQTSTGTVTGSPAFTAPEVLRGEPTSGASDVYGLGATLFCALTGHAAFERRSGEQVVAQFLRISAQPVPDLRERGIPEDVSALIEAAMCLDPQDRPTAALFGEQLQLLQLTHGFAVDQMALHVEQGSRLAVAPAQVTGIPAARGVGRREGTGNLPLELTSFVDRRSQVLEAKNLLSRSSLVTLTGIGGVGKSRLALRIAHKLQRDYADGVWLIELGELRDPSLLADVVAAAFGVRQVGRPMLEVLIQHLSTREVLLVLDNCEHMIEAVAKLVESLLRACPKTRILTTSRESLGLGGEAVLPVPPLRFPDPRSGSSVRGAAGYESVALFAERAAAAVPGFHLDEDNRNSVARICARLDGLPLAIELAAARLRTMPPEQILTRLTDRFAVLTRGRRDAPTRQQTLGWCIGWSYDLCTPTEQRLWGRLSVFAGSFELDAAEDVCGTDLTEPQFLDALSALVDKSILIREESGATVRFRVLETVQEYGSRKIIEAGEYTDLRRHHRDWYERLALDAEADWVSPRQLNWIIRLERELPNLRKALEFSIADRDAAGLRTAAALFSFWFSSGRLTEGIRWCERGLASTRGEATDRAKALFTISAFAAQLADIAAATSRAAELRILAEQQPADPRIGALLAYADGTAAISSGDLARAGVRLNDAVEGFSAPNDLAFHLRALVLLGWSRVLQGDMPSGVACLEKVLTVPDAHRDIEIRARALRPMALAAWQQGQHEQAERHLDEALRLVRPVVDPLVASVCVELLAWMAAEKPDARRAAVLLGAAYGLGHAVGSSIMFPHMAAYHEQCEQCVRDVLGRRGYESGYREGAAMSFQTAVDFALREQPRAMAQSDRGSASLTKRERQVADLIAEGLTNKAIAARLVISQRTAEGHVEHILTKLGFTSRAQIASWAAELGFVEAVDRFGERIVET
ncbi:protein kinase [Nocardia sp. NEAU-G5]|uniref:Protein kinase n=1 Tax=Nocardia albiluteola TaxID=2842303 RepID=A0ABS6B5G7_9NOCA|nr:protein kinase [Nocardia albiluteola]MBU3064453.1 protein kinase [Nocardia albiluteola]